MILSCTCSEEKFLTLHEDTMVKTKLRRAFDKFDKDKDGRVSREALLQVGLTSPVLHCHCESKSHLHFSILGSAKRKQ